jgi:hypothetical protein
MAKKNSKYAPKARTDESLLAAWKEGRSQLPKVMSQRMGILWIEKYSKGRIFGANVVKRMTGTLRVFTCRWGVRSRSKGGHLAFDPKAKKLTVIFDMQKDAYRMIAWEGLRGLLIAGTYHKVV